MNRFLPLLWLGCLCLLGSTPQAPEALRPGLDRALFFATANYDDPSLQDLQNPIKNAQALAARLKNDFGFETEVVPDPSLEEIEQKLEEYRLAYARGQYKSSGQLFIFFSGHGEEEYNEGYYLPRDANSQALWRTALPYTRWRGFIDAIECQHILVAIDACYSVTFDPGWKNMGLEDFQRVGELSEGQKLLNKHLATKARLFFTSDGEGDETPDKSSFAKKLQEGLIRPGGVDGILTSSDVWASLSRALPTPHRGEFGSDEVGSSFLFIKQKRDIDDAKAWIKTKDQNSIAAYEAFIQDFPDSDFAELAQTSIGDLRRLAAERREADAWRQVQANPSVATYTRFIERFPRSPQVREARAGIQQLEAQAARTRDDAAYQLAEALDTRAAYQSYLDRFGQGRHRSEATARIKTLEAETALARAKAAWEQAEATGTQSAYRQFLADYPQSIYADLARVRLKGPNRTTTGNPSSIQDLPQGPTMLFIPGGSFTMGSDEGSSDEKPPHEVTVSDFYLAETEVTNAQFCVFLNAKGNQEEGGATWLELEDSDCLIEKTGGQFRPKSGKADHPVIEVSWYGARAYCRWLSETTEAEYRLPTEAEWEYAAGGGESNRTKWAGTGQENNLRAYANYDGTGGKDRYDRTAPVKSFQPNGLDLYDMSGNVWEWCQDWYDSGYYASSPSRDPPGPSSGSSRVIRGGSWFTYPVYCRVARRYDYHPDPRNGGVGFRVARSF